MERTQESERPDSMVSETSSVRDSVGSFKEWEDYNSALQDVLNWLSQAERTLESQENISDDVDAVKKQFHEHEVNKYRNILSLFIRVFISRAIRMPVFHSVTQAEWGINFDFSKNSLTYLVRLGVFHFGEFKTLVNL